MSKQEFLKQLAFRLHHLQVEERNDIINYYDELIEDKKDREGLDEEAIIKELGSLDDIAKRVAPKGSEVKIHYDEEKKEEKGPNEAKDTKLIMSIVSIPVGFIIGVIMFSLSLTMVITAITFVASGIGCLTLAIGSIVSNPLVALFEFACSLIMFGLTLIVIPLFSKAIKLLTAWIKKMWKKYFTFDKEVN